MKPLELFLFVLLIVVLIMTIYTIGCKHSATEDQTTNIVEPLMSFSTFEPATSPELEEPETQTDPLPDYELCIFDCPLSADIQLYLFDICRDYKVDPALVLAIVEKESNFRADAIGDNGHSFGLMQIQKVWHIDRMKRLGVTDLLDPKQNILVGVDLLHELLTNIYLYLPSESGNFAYDETITWVIMAYNAGPSGAVRYHRLGTVSVYARTVNSHMAMYQEQDVYPAIRYYVFPEE